MHDGALITFMVLLVVTSSYVDYMLDPQLQGAFAAAMNESKISLAILDATLAPIVDGNAQNNGAAMGSAGKVLALGLRLEGMTEMGWLGCEFRHEDEGGHVIAHESFDLVLTETRPSNRTNQEL